MAESPSELNNKNSLKDFVLEIRFLISIIRRFKWVLLVLTVAGVSLSVWKIKHFVPMYTAQMKFVMKSDPNGLGSSLASLSSLLGAGGTGSQGSSPLERIVELISSDRIMGNALLHTAVVNNKRDLLINHYIELENLKESWKNDSDLKYVSFNKGVQFTDLNFGQRKAMKRISGRLFGRAKGSIAVVAKSFDKKSGVVTLNGVYKDESFAIAITNEIYAEIISFYIDQSVSTTRHNVELLTEKVDSIRNELNATRQSFAENTDRALGLLLQKHRVENRALAYKESVLSLMYAESQKNLETLKFIEASTVPSFAVIDAPYSPLMPSVISKKLYLILGLILPGFLFILIYRLSIVLKALYKKAIESVNE